jgi:phage regulator Rha-like protein
MFQLNKEEYSPLRSQFVILKEKEIIGSRRGKHAKYLPYAFTEQGIAMLSSVLRSKRAIQVNIQIMRTFVRLKKILLTYKGVAEKMKKLEKKYEKHDVKIKVIFDAIRQVMLQPEMSKKRIGFNVWLF